MPACETRPDGIPATQAKSVGPLMTKDTNAFCSDSAMARLSASGRIVWLGSFALASCRPEKLTTSTKTRPTTESLTCATCQKRSINGTEHAKVTTRQACLESLGTNNAENGALKRACWASTITLACSLTLTMRREPRKSLGRAMGLPRRMAAPSSAQLLQLGGLCHESSYLAGALCANNSVLRMLLDVVPK